jgi:adenosylcobinamide-GDP ribazoletransferase
MFDRFLSTLSLVSRIPIKPRFSFDPSRTDFYLPLTGLFPAVFGGSIFLTGERFIGNSLVTVILALIVQYLGFNLFHLDGLVDTADAFLGKFDREKRIAVLKDSRTGTYGLFAGISSLGLKAALLQALFPLALRFPAAILAYPLSGRFCAALVPAMAQPLKPGGLGALLKGSRPWRAAAGTLLALGLWTALTYPVPLSEFPRTVLFIPFLASPLVSLFFAGLYKKHLGGYTGDALGAAVETGELLHLAAVFTAARVCGFLPG